MAICDKLWYLLHDCKAETVVGFETRLQSKLSRRSCSLPPYQISNYARLH